MEINIIEERKKMLSNRLEIIESFRDKNKHIIKATNNMYDVPNVGITFNNKIVEIINIYKRGNKEIVTSKLFSLLYNHLYSETEKANKVVSKILDFIRSNLHNPNINEEIDDILKNIRDMLKRYKEIDDYIFKFDIKNNLMDAYQTQLDRNKEIEEDGGFSDFILHKSDFINQYNNDLKDLGYDIVIPNQDVKKQGL